MQIDNMRGKNIEIINKENQGVQSGVLTGDFDPADETLEARLKTGELVRLKQGEFRIL